MNAIEKKIRTQKTRQSQDRILADSPENRAVQRAKNAADGDADCAAGRLNGEKIYLPASRPEQR